MRPLNSLVRHHWISSGMADEVRWVDRETVAFVRGNERVLVWCDFAPGLLSSGRVIREESIKTWLSGDDRPTRTVNSAERDQIVAAVTRYWRRPWRRVTTSP